MENKPKKRSGPDPKYSDAFKRQVVKEFYSGTESRKAISQRYGLPSANTVSKWANELRSRGEEFRDLPGPLTSEERNDIKALQSRMKELEKQLEYERLRSLGFETMIDIAEKELKIQIRKKSDTKPSKP
jgi:transposase-like protein